MKLLRLDQSGLLEYTCRQLAHFFPDDLPLDRQLLCTQIPETLSRLEYCIKHVRMWSVSSFDHLHSTQYCLYLYYLSNTLWRNTGNSELATRLFLLNKALNGIDCFYEIELPDIIFIGHSVGIVLAKATYGSHLVLYQNSTVGKNHGVAPVIGDGVVMYPNTSIIGRCNIGAGTVLAQGVGVINRDTPGNCYVFSASDGDLKLSLPKRDILADIFRD
jgi:serine O-acetyltransferase